MTTEEEEPPDHPDYLIMCSIVMEGDIRATKERGQAISNILHDLGVDEKSFDWMAQQRAMAYLHIQSVEEAKDRNKEVTASCASWFDGFRIGIEWDRRKNVVPTKDFLQGFGFDK